MMTKRDMIDLYNEHADARGDIKRIPRETTMTKAQVQRKLERIERQADSWTDM